VYTATFTPTASTNSTTASITVAASSYTDVAGNSGGAGTTPTLSFDTKAPEVLITANNATLLTGGTATLTFTFTEAPVGFTASDVAVTNGSISTPVVDSTDSKKYTATFTPSVTNSLNGTVSIAAGAFTDAAGNNSLVSNTVALNGDTVSPTLTITSNKSALKSGETATVTFTFSEAVSGFTDTDIAATGGTISNLAVSSTDSKVYTATFTPTANTDTTTASITVAPRPMRTRRATLAAPAPRPR